MRGSLLSEFLDRVDSELYEASLSRPVEEIAIDMHLVAGPAEAKRPVNVGLMFFNERPDDFFPYSRIEVVDKPDPTGHGMTEKTFVGPLDRQLRDALAYIRNYVIKEYVTKVPNQAEAIRVFNWPYRAVEEALSNAVYHRSYQIYEPITVTVAPESMDILSLPGPDRSITGDDLVRGVLISSRYRNRRIGDYLKELRMVEGRNTGVPLMLEAMRRNGSDRPIFRTDEERSYFRVVLPVHSVFLGGQYGSPGLGVGRGRRRTREELCVLIKQNLLGGNLSPTELSAALGYSKLTDTMRAVVRDMMERGEVQYLYPDKPKSRNQKICLVGSGAMENKVE